MNTVLLVPDGVGVRNFVLGSFLEQLSDRSRIHVLHAIPPARLAEYSEEISDGVEWHRLEPYRETPIAAALRYSLAYAQMNWVDTRSMRFNASRAIAGSWKTRLLHAASRVVGKTAAFPFAIRALERAHCAAVAATGVADGYERLFERIRPSVLFCSHQRPPVILPAVLAARRLGIPTATFIFSWDNLSSKGRIAAPFDHYLVWSATMREELQRFYPDVSASRIHIVGTPQFDPYGDEALRLTRAEFFRQIGADPARPMICFSGGDAGNCPEDPHHVRILLDLIRQGRIGGSPQVVLRPSPADNGRRYTPVRDEYPELIYRPPLWIHSEQDSWDTVFPRRGDAAILANLAAHADLNVNFGSTMALDFSLHDKPVVIPCMDVSSPLVHGMPLLEFCLQFDHYRPVAELGAARFPTSVDRFAADVNAYLADPSLDREGRRRLVALHVNEPPGRASRRVIETLEWIAGPAAALRRGGERQMQERCA